MHLCIKAIYMPQAQNPGHKCFVFERSESVPKDVCSGMPDFNCVVSSDMSNNAQGLTRHFLLLCASYDMLTEC